MGNDMIYAGRFFWREWMKVRGIERWIDMECVERVMEKNGWTRFGYYEESANIPPDVFDKIHKNLRGEK